MQHAFVPILGFVAASGTGKTTLLTAVIPLLTQRGLRVGAIKHSHHDFQIDQPGKDSHRLREAGATTVLLVSQLRRAIITEITPEHEPRLEHELTHLNQSDLDLILVEGFKTAHFPKIELHRAALGQPFCYPGDADIIAVASDSEPATTTIAWLDINQPAAIAEFILSWKAALPVVDSCHR